MEQNNRNATEMTPIVTVLITAYNTPAVFLREAVKSALDQDINGLEVLLVDDGSIPALVTHLADIRDPRLVYRYMDHLGLPQVLRVGMEMARGKYLAVLDHDDRLTPGSLRVRLEKIEKERTGFVYGDIEIISTEGNVLSRQIFPQIRSVSKLVRAGLVKPVGPIKHSAVLMERAVALQLGNYDPSLPSEYDLDLILKIALLAGFSRVPAFVAQYRVHPGNHTASPVYRLRQIRCRWLVIDRFMTGKMGRIAAKIFVSLVFLSKALWQLISYRRPGFLFSGFRKRA